VELHGEARRGARGTGSAQVSPEIFFEKGYAWRQNSAPEFFARNAGLVEDLPSLRLDFLRLQSTTV